VTSVAFSPDGSVDLDVRIGRNSRQIPTGRIVSTNNVAARAPYWEFCYLLPDLLQANDQGEPEGWAGVLPGGTIDEHHHRAASQNIAGETGV
jgi:hypothetical protein